MSRHLVHRASFTFETPKGPGIYRVIMVFESSNGEKVARYGKYFRAAPPQFGARVAVSDEEVVAGEVLSARLENVGTTKIHTGYGYRIQRFVDGGWEDDPVLQGTGSVPRVLVTLGPIATFDCRAIPIPSDHAPGRYRVLKKVQSKHGSPPISIAEDFLVAAKVQ